MGLCWKGRIPLDQHPRTSPSFGKHTLSTHCAAADGGAVVGKASVLSKRSREWRRQVFYRYAHGCVITNGGK